MSTLHKPVLQPGLPLDRSVLQQPMVPLYISVLKQPVLPGRVFSIEPALPLYVSEHSKAACAVSERVYPIVQQTELPVLPAVLQQQLVFHLDVSVQQQPVLWQKMAYSS